MSGRASRDKGKRGERAARNLLTERDWTVDDLTDGVGCADFIAVDPRGRAHWVEVKACKSIDVPRFVAQARAQAGKRPWLLMCHVYGSRSWLVGDKTGWKLWKERG